MTARRLMLLLDRECRVRHPSGLVSYGTVADVRMVRGELRVTVAAITLTEDGRSATAEHDVPGHVVWFAPPLGVFGKPHRNAYDLMRETDDPDADFPKTDQETDR